MMRMDRTHPRLQALRDSAVSQWRLRSTSQRVYFALWGVYLFCYPFAVVGIAFNVHANFSMAWAGSFLLFVEGALAVCWLGLLYGWLRGGLLALIIALGAASGETLGVLTGWPFGPYRYTAILLPQLPGGVPLPVIGAWLLVMVAAVATARALAPRAPRVVLIALATGLGVALDVILEPVAVHIVGYWRWLATGPYYGIPTLNFVGWAVLCAIFAATMLSFPISSTDQATIVLTTAGVWLYLLTAMMFGVIALTHHLPLAALVGCVAVVGLIAWLVRVPAIIRDR